MAQSAVTVNRAWHAEDAQAVLVSLGAADDGLSEGEAAERLARVGPNFLQPPAPEPAWRILLRQLRGIVILLLVVATGASLLARDFIDAVAIGVVLVLNVALGFAIELRARRAVESLRRLNVSEATVVRAGEVRRVDARTLVPGDVIQLEPGQMVPADARLLRSAELRVVESTLTGESEAAGKRADVVLSPDTPLPDRDNMVYKATTAVSGGAHAVVVETGMRTEIGRIGTLVGQIEEESTPLERRLDALGRQLAIVAVIVGIVVAALGLLRGADLREMLETGIAVAVAAVPEGLPAVVTITMAIGTRRMARRHALIRRLPAVESLGAVTVVCTDKTGTLTTGEQTVTTIWVPDVELHVTGAGYDAAGEIGGADGPGTPETAAALERVLRVAALNNRAGIAEVEGRIQPSGDPTEVALLVAARKHGVDVAQLRGAWPEVAELPFSSERMVMATFHRRRDGTLLATLKGAPARVLDRCALTPELRAGVERRNAALAARGLRVLAMADGSVKDTSDDALRELNFTGLVGMTDPLAPGVFDTVGRLHTAGVRTVMITGDQRGTALAIARDVQLAHPDDDVLDGADVDRLADAELAARVDRVAAYSRVSPEAKLRIVRALQERGEIVAMLGDGVNDAAALKRADVGVAMGGRGTDVAKDAAGVILTDDRFQTISAAVEEGRVVFDNVRKFVFYLFSCNLAEIVTLVGAGVVGLPTPLSALQILWLNLVTDTFPALALAKEPAEEDVMRRPPRDPRAGILTPDLLRATVQYALLIGGVTLLAYLWALSGWPDDPRIAMTTAFMTLALSQILHLGNARSTRDVSSPQRALSNRWAVGALLLAIALQLSAAFAPSLANLLGVSALPPVAWAVIVGAALVPAVAGQLAKRARRDTRRLPDRE